MALSIDRRALLGAAALSAFPRRARASALAQGMFTHGIASGDPTADSIVLWTRFVPTAPGGAIAWEVSETEDFSNLAQRGELTPSFASDFCVKADARGLLPGRRYFYRFLSAAGPSPIGLTRTAPAGAAAQFSAALFSCANMPFGYFHAYAHAARREEIDIVLQVGDYIYETPRGRYPSAAEAVPGRAIDPQNELLTLGDYYQRYASYHTDAALLELRRVKPLCAVWDDHELVNNTWNGGAQDHQAYEGDFWARMAAATKAYFDWMPMRRPQAPGMHSSGMRSSGMRIFRSLDWGDLARIVLLDTRLIGRSEQLDYRTMLAPRLAQGGQDGARIAAEFRRAVLDNPNRTMLGGAQEAWLARELAASKARGQTWQILAQQVVMGDQFAPPGLSGLFPEGASAGARQWFAAGIEMSALGLPWNLDSWSGYPPARARFLNACAAQANNAIVLGGDSHNCWANNLAAADGARLAALEFAGGSVSSPGFERTLSNAAPGQRESLMASANPHLAWCDVTRRGYAMLRFTPSACEAEWLGFDSVASPIAPAPSITRLSAGASAAAGPAPWERIPS